MNDSAPLAHSLPDGHARQEHRVHPRYTVPAMYSLIRIRCEGDRTFNRMGHIYDVSQGGVRFELDEPIEPGTWIEARAMLPGYHHINLEVTGRVIRIHDDRDEPGPIRMAMMFDPFANEEDANRFAAYLEAKDTPLAAA